MMTTVESTPYLHNPRKEMHHFIPKGTKRVLDIGCHTGSFGKSLKGLGIETVWGIEANAETARVAAEVLDKVIVGYFAADQVPDSYFDVIAFNDVLEHMENPGDALRLSIPKLTSDGVVIASIPNLRHIDNLVHILWEKDFRYESWGIRDETHLRFFTKKSIVRLFESNGFHVDTIEGVNEHWWTWSRLRRLAFKLFPAYLEDTKYVQFAVVARPVRAH